MAKNHFLPFQNSFFKFIDLIEKNKKVFSVLLFHRLILLLFLNILCFSFTMS